MEDFDEQEALFEALTLERNFVEAISPPFTGYGSDTRCWNWYGGPWPVPPRYNKKNLRDIEYRNREGKLHRLSGPAYISKLYNFEAWYKDGQRHRIGGPAYTHNSNFVWFKEGKLHNLDGPAVIDGAGPYQYWIDGVKYSPKQYKWEIQRRKKKNSHSKK